MSRLLLLDDHQVVREGLRSVLQAAGHDVVFDTDCAEQALAKCSSGEVDVLVLDIHLQGLTGLQVLRQMRALGLTVATVVLSMSAQPHHIIEAMRLGALGYVLKGSPSSTLLQAVTAVANGARYMDKSIPPVAGYPGAKEGSAVDPVGALSTRELQILGLVVRGNTSAAIGVKLGLSPKTVETYRSRLMQKLELHDLSALVLFAVRWGLLESQ